VAFASRDSIYAYEVDSSEPEFLSVLPVKSGYGYPHSLAWSPDGQRIALVNGNKAWRTSANVLGAAIWIVDADGGEPVRVTDDTTMNVSPQWLPDSRHLLFISDREGQREVYVVEVGPRGPRGEPQKVAGPTDAHSISVSADGGTLAYAKFLASQNIVAIPIPRVGSISIDDAVPVTEGSQVIEGHALSPDGEWIVFSSNLGGKQDLYKLRLEGGTPELVTTDVDGHVFAPDWSGAGDEIAFYSSLRDGIIVVSADGGSTEQATNHPHIGRPDWSPDGLAIAFQSTGPRALGEANLWVASRDSVGGAWSDAERLTDFQIVSPDWAPDGRSLIAYSRGALVRVSRDGNVLSRTEPSMVGLQEFGPGRFSHDGSRIYTIGTHEDGSRGVWRIPINGGQATKVVAFNDPSLITSSPEVGAEHLYLNIIEYESDIWVMDLEW
jgi:Tol biopolymer transport system component